MPTWAAFLVSLTIGLLYAGLAVLAACVALFAPTPVQRRAAREVLRLLLRRNERN
jgi:hypothetical protein